MLSCALYVHSCACSGGGKQSSREVEAQHREVALVADEHDCHVGVGVLPRVLQPARQVVEGLAPARQHMLALALAERRCSGAAPPASGRPTDARGQEAQRRKQLGAVWVSDRRRAPRNRPRGGASGAGAPSDVVHQQRAGRAAVVRARDGAERLLAGLRARRDRSSKRCSGRTPLPARAAGAVQARGARAGGRTVSHICSLICFPSMLIMRAPNSTPMVRSCTGWKRLSVNCSSRQDFPTPARTLQSASAGPQPGDAGAHAGSGAKAHPCRL